MLDIALLAIAVLPFTPSLFSPFLFDDISLDFYPHRIRQHRPARYQGWLGDLRLWRATDGRPFTWWTFQRNFDFLHFCIKQAGEGYSRVGRAVRIGMAGFHGVNFLIHAANVILAHHLLMEWISPERAALAAAVFAVHPLQAQSVAYISGRYGVLSAFFALAALNAFFLCQWWILPLCFYLGLAAKEDIISAPFLMGALWVLK